MSVNTKRADMNLTVLMRISDYLTRHPRFIEAADVREMTALGVSEEQAVYLLACAALGMDEAESAAGREMARRYLLPGLCKLDARDFRKNPYMRTVRFPEAKLDRWEMTKLSYAPYELFVRDDLEIMPDGREIVRLGYFDEPFVYPAILQDGREWMTITPNEIATMADAIAKAHGHVAAMGLGLGYYAFMVSEKEDVTYVTIVERDCKVIELFERHILPQFPHREKIGIVRADAFDYAGRQMATDEVDFAFVDLWHDVSDGAGMYLRMKLLERCAPKTQFAYWIETSIRSFLKGLED